MSKPFVIKLYQKGFRETLTINEIYELIKNYLKDSNKNQIEHDNNILFFNCNSQNYKSLEEKLLKGGIQGEQIFLILNNNKLFSDEYIKFLIIKYASLKKKDCNSNLLEYFLPYINENFKDKYLNNELNNTLFHYSCENSHVSIIKVLFKKFESYEDANQTNSLNKTAYDLARDNYGNNSEVIKLLHNFKWINSEKKIIKDLQESINSLKRKADSNNLQKFKITKTSNKL